MFILKGERISFYMTLIPRNFLNLLSSNVLEKCFSFYACESLPRSLSGKGEEKGK